LRHSIQSVIILVINKSDFHSQSSDFVITLMIIDQIGLHSVLQYYHNYKLYVKQKFTLKITQHWIPLHDVQTCTLTNIARMWLLTVNFMSQDYFSQFRITAQNINGVIKLIDMLARKVRKLILLQLKYSVHHSPKGEQWINYNLLQIWLCFSFSRHHVPNEELKIQNKTPSSFYWHTVIKMGIKTTCSTHFNH